MGKRCPAHGLVGMPRPPRRWAGIVGEASAAGPLWAQGIAANAIDCTAELPVPMPRPYEFRLRWAL